MSGCAVQSVHLRRVSQALAATALAISLAGCGSFWPWSGGDRPKPAPLPALTGGATARVLWSVPVGAAGAGFQPIAVGDAVSAASRDGTVVRVDAASGRVAWRTSIGRPLIAGVGSDGRTVAVAARDGTVIALDADGKTKWSTSLGAEIVSVPAVGEGVVVVRGSDNRVSALDVEGGRRRWTFQRQNPTLVLKQTNAALVVPGAAFVGLPGGRLVAIALQNGAVRWESAVAQPRGATEIERIADVVGTPRLDGRDVCSVSFQGRLGCFDAATGRALWARDFSSSTGLDVDGRLVVSVDDKDQVHAFTRTGASQWKQDKLSLRELSAPLALSRHVVVGDGQGLVHLLARDDGQTVARVATDGAAVIAAPVIAGARVVVQTASGALHGIAIE